MNEQLLEKLKKLPEDPGIYKMLDKNQNIIYIGKSKCLKKRVHSYFVPSPKWEKVKKMVPKIDDISWEVTDTHLEAMLLECRSIKEIKPYFNTMMKNDERYFYLNVGQTQRKASLYVTYDRQELSYGPFRSRGQIEAVVQTMKNFYPLQRSSDQFELVYHIFPVNMDRELYQENARELSAILSEPALLDQFRQSVEQQMLDVVKEQKFELAVRYRDFIENLRYLQKSLIDARKWSSQTILYTVPVGKKSKIFYIHNGIIVYSKVYSKITEERKRSFIKQAEKKSEGENWMSEKSRLDYRDILFSELQQALPEAIEVLDGESR